MKIEFNDIKLTPPHMDFGFCVFGEPNEKIQNWINYWGFETSESGKFTNIDLNNDEYEKFFNVHIPYEYMDGFSPNLNKNLHVGHLSNFVIANALQKMEICKSAIAILGDTLEGEVDSIEAYEKYVKLCEKFNYTISDVYYASKQELKNTDLLIDGTDKYEGTKIFTLSDNTKLVGIKNDGSTTYFYQDIALAETLNNSTLYVTGNEQNNHFSQVKDIYPHINHIGLGLVTLGGEKMSSRKGNVIYLSEIFDILKEDFDDEYLIYNILCAQFLKSNPSSNKDINMDLLSNPKTSLGLYLSYTLARLQSAGVNLEEVKLKDKLKFIYLKSQKELNPSLLLKELENISKNINQLYLTNIIKDNEENKKMFTNLGNQLLSGMKKLGMFNIKKV